jgi:hypothetical protein
MDLTYGFVGLRLRRAPCQFCTGLYGKERHGTFTVINYRHFQENEPASSSSRTEQAA